MVVRISAVMLRRLIVGSSIVIIAIICFRPSFAEEIPSRVSVTDKEIIERLTRLETRLEQGHRALNKTIDDLNVAFEQEDGRFADHNAVVVGDIISCDCWAVWLYCMGEKKRITPGSAEDHEVGETSGCAGGVFSQRPKLKKDNEVFRDVMRRVRVKNTF